MFLDYTILTLEDDGDNYISYGEGECYCEQEIGSDLGSFRNKNNIQSYWTLSQLHDTTNKTCWLGLRYRDNLSNWQWSDGSNFSYTNWEDKYPNNESNRDWYETLIFIALISVLCLFVCHRVDLVVVCVCVCVLRPVNKIQQCVMYTCLFVCSCVWEWSKHEKTKKKKREVVLLFKHATHITHITHTITQYSAYFIPLGNGTWGNWYCYNWDFNYNETRNVSYFTHDDDDDDYITPNCFVCNTPLYRIYEFSITLSNDKNAGTRDRIWFKIGGTIDMTDNITTEWISYNNFDNINNGSNITYTFNATLTNVGPAKNLTILTYGNDNLIFTSVSINHISSFTTNSNTSIELIFPFANTTTTTTTTTTTGGCSLITLDLSFDDATVISNEYYLQTFNHSCPFNLNNDTTRTAATTITNTTNTMNNNATNFMVSSMTSSNINNTSLIVEDESSWGIEMLETIARYLLFFVIGFVVIVTFIAYIYHNCILLGSDTAQYGSILMFAAHLGDFWTDIVFTITLYVESRIIITMDNDNSNYNYNSNSNYGAGVNDPFKSLEYLFYFALGFTIGPYILSCMIAIYHVERWRHQRQEIVRQWFEHYDRLIYGLTIISGFYCSIQLCKSKLFYKECFHLTLKENEWKKLGNFRFVNIVLIENIPQFYIQLIYLLNYTSFSLNGNESESQQSSANIVLFSMLFSTLSILMALMSQISRLCQMR